MNGNYAVFVLVKVAAKIIHQKRFTKSELDKNVLRVGSPAQSQMSLLLEYAFTRKLVVAP